MSDEPAKFILGDTAISALEEHPGGKRFFGRRKRQRPPLTHCENCGAQLTGRYCGQCGQAAVDYRRSFRHVIVDVLDSFLNWDSKFVATIGLLIVKPWRLTNEFLSGKRVRYVHPLRLYLLASILFFFAVNYWAKSIPTDHKNLTAEDRAELEADLQDKDLPPAARAALEQALKPSPSAAASPAPPTSSPAKIQSEPVQPGPEDPGDSIGRWLELRAKEKLGEHGTNKQLFIRTLISNLPYMMLCCIPLFAFVLKVLYLRCKIFYIDHLIYALHIHTFAYAAIMLIVLATIGLNRSAPDLLAGWTIGFLWLAFVIQIFLSIRRVYRQGWLISLIKFCFGGVAYLVVLSIALFVTFLVTLALP
jgi:hypothetical protein